jgi:hypothetical protein
MEFPPPSQQQVELGELDREIARRQVELTALIEQRMALTPLRQMPPPQGAPVSQRQGTEAAKVLLALGAVVLMAAVASFAGFVWPHLTLPLRTAALTLLVVLLGAGALYAKPRLVGLAEALAATAGVSTVVLTTWFYAASTSNQQTYGVGLALGIAALIVGAAAVAWRLQAWVWTASVTAPIAALYVTTGVEQHYLPAFIAAGLFAMLAWKLHWPQLVWASGALFAVALATTSVSLHDHGAGYSAPYVATLIIAALAATGRPAMAIDRNSANAFTLNVAIAGGVGVMLWGYAAVSSPTLIGHIDAGAITLAFALLAARTVSNRRDEVVRVLLGLAMVASTANLSPVVLVVTTLIVVVLCSSPAAAIIIACALSATAPYTASGDFIRGDSPVWLLLTLSVVPPTLAAFRHRDRVSVLVGALFATAASAAVYIDVLNARAVEALSVIIAVVLGGFWLFARTRVTGQVLSWWLTPALLAALGPTTVLSIAGAGQSIILRTTVVLVLGAAFISFGVQHKLGGFVVAPAACIALIASVRIIDAASQVPVWIPLVFGGAVLLAVGARFERLAEPRQRAASWFSELR